MLVDNYYKNPILKNECLELSIHVYSCETIIIIEFKLLLQCFKHIIFIFRFTYGINIYLHLNSSGYQSLKFFFL